MGKWVERQLGDLIRIKHGFAFAGEYITSEENDIVLVTPGNFNIGGGFKFSGKKYYNGEVPKDYILEPNSIIVTMTDLSKNADTLGYAAIVPNDENTYLHNQRIGLVSITSDDVDKNFLYWVLRTHRYQRRIANTSNGANVKHTSPQRIYEYKFMLPNLPTQHFIANILFTYNDLIENNNRRIELLEKATKKLYKEWFVQFRFPNHENTKFVNGLPEGWEDRQLGDIVDIGSSKRVYLSDYVETGIPFYRSKEIIQLSEGQAIGEPLFISKKKYEEFSTKFGAPHKNDILITSVGTIGESYLSDGHTFYFKDGNLTWIKTSKSPMLAILIFCWLNTDVGKQTLLAATIGTSQSALTIENLKKVKICVPDDKVLEKFYKCVVTFEEEKVIIQKQTQNLKKQLDLLLPRLMSGRLEV